MSARTAKLDRTFERAHEYIGFVTSDPAWRKDHWVDIPPQAYDEASEAGADGDQLEVGAIFDRHFARIAHREAETKFGVKLS